MIYLKLYEDFENSTFDVRTRYSYTHPKTHRTLSFSHEYFTTRINGKIVSSCIITYPRLSPNKFTEEGKHSIFILVEKNYLVIRMIILLKYMMLKVEKEGKDMANFFLKK